MNRKTSPYCLGILLLSLWLPAGILGAGFTSDTLASARSRMTADRFFAQNRFDSAKVYFAASAESALLESNTRAVVDARFGLAQCEVRLSHYRQAIQILTQLDELHINAACVDCAHQGPIYSLLSHCCLATDDFPASVKYAKMGIEKNTQQFGADDERTAAAYYALGGVEKTRGEYRDAMHALRTASTILAKIDRGVNRRHANTLFVLGSVYDDVDSYDSALVLYDRSLGILKQLGQSLSFDAATINVYRMTSFGHLADYEQAITCGRSALSIFDSLGMSDHQNAASACAKLAEMYFAVGDYELTERYLLHAIEVFERRYPEKRSAIGAYSILLAEVFVRTGEIENAVRLTEKGLGLFESVYGAEHPQIGFRYESAAKIYAEAKKYDDALKNYRKALAIRKQVAQGSDGIQLITLNSAIGGVFIRMGRFDSARFYLDAASSIELSAGNRNILQSAFIQQRYGDLASGLQQIDSALGRYSRAVSLLTGSDDRAETFPALRNAFRTAVHKKELIEIIERMAGVYEQQYRISRKTSSLKNARSLYLSAMEMIDELRRRYDSDESKFFLARHSSLIFQKGCRISLQLFDLTRDTLYLKDAFLIADRNKGNVLMDRLADNIAKANSAIPDSLLQAEHSLLDRMTYLETLILRAEGTSTGRTRQFRSEHFAVSREHQLLLELIESRYPEYYRSKYAQHTLTVSDARSVLENGEVLVEYMVTDDDGLVMFILSKGSLSVQKVRHFAEIAALAGDFTASLKTIDPEAFWTSGREMYQRIIRPFISSLSNVSKLTIIPDGVLHSVPFEAIPMSLNGRKTSDFSAADYLIKRFEISYAYSAAYRRLRTADNASRVSSGASFAGFAPVFRDSSKGNDLFANRSFAEHSGITDVRSITLDGKRFNELKYSEEEVVSIGRKLKERSVAASTFLFTDATEQNFKTAAPAADILHIATHGFINEKDPKLSAVIFSQPDQANSIDDGILYANETVNLRLKAQLVVLSSCESGVGRLVNGEGMIALSRGLLYAGAQNVVFSLWKVSDRQTFRLMDDFYGGIADGKNFGPALRSAKLSMIRSKESSFPGKWSGFVLIGN